MLTCAMGSPGSRKAVNVQQRPRQVRPQQRKVGEREENASALPPIASGRAGRQTVAFRDTRTTADVPTGGLRTLCERALRWRSGALRKTRIATTDARFTITLQV